MSEFNYTCATQQTAARQKQALNIRLWRIILSMKYTLSQFGNDHNIIVRIPDTDPDLVCHIDKEGKEIAVAGHFGNPP